MTEQVIGDDLAALARELVEYVAATDLPRLSTERLNDLSGCARWLRVEPDDGYEAVHIVNGLAERVTEDVTVGGLTIRASQDEYRIEGDEALTAALIAAVEKINAEIARRMPHEIDAAWRRYERYEARRQQRLAQRRRLGWLRTFAPRRTNRRTPRPRRTARASSPPSRDGPGADDSDLDPAPIGGGL